MNDIPQDDSPRWQPLERVERRVVGVLVEKAKTTPDNYPLSLNSLVNGANQKSNRSPQMQLDEEQVARSDRSAADGLEPVSIIQGDGRVEKYRHLMYEWLGVDKVELAVMAELLLRGEQTLGDLRGRAARMEPIKGVAELQPIVDSLRQKELIQLLTPPGRGVRRYTHALPGSGTGKTPQGVRRAGRDASRRAARIAAVNDATDGSCRYRRDGFFTRRGRHVETTAGRSAGTDRQNRGAARGVCTA